MADELSQTAAEYVEKSSLSDDDKEFMQLFLDVVGQKGGQQILAVLEQNILPSQKLVDLIRNKISYLALQDKEKWDQLVNEEASLIKKLLE